MNTRLEPLLVGGGDEGLKLGKKGCGRGVGRAFGMGTECAGALTTGRRGKRRPDPHSSEAEEGSSQE